MAQHPIEVILTRELASCLVTPVFLVDPDGSLLFYNEAAESILGRRFDETGEMAADVWATAFRPTDEDGRAIPTEKLPLVIAFRERRAVHDGCWLQGLDGVRRKIEVTAFPLLGQSGRHLGAVAIFWEAGAR